MATIITKDEFDNLPDALKAKFKPEGEGFALLEEDVSGLKKSQAQLLKEKKELEERYSGLDPEEYKALKAAQDKAADEQLKAAGEFEKLREQLETRHKTELEKVTAERNTILSNLKREKLANALTEKGVLPDRVKYLLGELDPQIELASTDSGFQLKKIGGIGDAAEFEGIISSVKEASPFFFAADSTPGSGASGSDGNGGSGGAKTIPHDQWSKMDVKAQAAFIKGGGVPVD